MHTKIIDMEQESDEVLSLMQKQKDQKIYNLI